MNHSQCITSDDSDMILAFRGKESERHTGRNVVPPTRQQSSVSPMDGFGMDAS